MNAIDWYEKTVGDDSVNAVARKSGIPQTTLNGQLRKESLAPDTMVAVARAYGRDALDALVIHGLITEEDIRAHYVRTGLEKATDLEISREVSRRLVGDTTGIYDRPLHFVSEPPAKFDPRKHYLAGGKDTRDEDEDFTD